MDVLLRLLEMIYMKLHPYSIVLQQYFDVSNEIISKNCFIIKDSDATINFIS